jgi:hypothetical protein
VDDAVKIFSHHFEQQIKETLELENEGKPEIIGVNHNVKLE